MNHQTNNRTAGLLVGILFLLFSLPVGWFTIAHPQVAGGQVPAFLLPTGPVTVTGLTGKLGFFGIQLPIWLVLALGILSLSFTTTNQRGITSLPRFALVATWMVSAIYVLVAFWLCLFAADLKLHLGPVLAAVGLGLGLGSGFAAMRRKA